MVHIHQGSFSFPAIDGLHCRDGVVYPLLDAACSVMIPTILSAALEDPHLALLYPSFEVSAGDGVNMLVGGGGSWEGEGFLALVDGTTRETHWLLYAGEGEEFVEAFQRAGVVYAVSGGYPLRIEWEIRGGNPPSAMFERKNAI
jgi:hypothetical protein